MDILTLAVNVEQEDPENMPRPNNTKQPSAEQISFGSKNPSTASSEKSSREQGSNGSGMNQKAKQILVGAQEENDYAMMISEMQDLLGHMNEVIENELGPVDTPGFAGPSKSREETKGEDDEEERDDFDSSSSSESPKEQKNMHNPEHIETIFLSDFQKLKEMRILLESVFGADDFLKAYKIIKEHVESSNTAF